MPSRFSQCFDGLWLTCEIADGAVTALRFGASDPSEGTPPNDAALWERAAGQLREFMAGERRAFDLPLRCEGTEFQRLVWEGLLAIPYGETRAYGELARLVGRPRAVRAVGQACHRNPIAIVIPCHRVIGSNGELTGFGGGIETKKRLLDLEKRVMNTSEPEETDV